MRGTVLTGGLAVLVANTAALATPSNRTALADVQIETTTEPCDGSISAGGKNIYAHNTNTAKAVTATVQYDTKPGAQSFPLLNGSVASFTEHFPKSFAVTLSAGSRRLVGCSTVSRSVSGTVLPIAISVSKVGARYAFGNPPAWPTDDPKQYVALMIAPLGGCGPGAHAAGVFYVMNLHPGQQIRAVFGVIDNHGHTVGQLTPDVAPNGFTRTMCSNADARNFTLSTLLSASYSGPTVAQRKGTRTAKD